MALQAARFQMADAGFRDFTSSPHWMATMLDDTEMRDHTISDYKKGMKAAYDAGYVDGGSGGGGSGGGGGSEKKRDSSGGGSGPKVPKKGADGHGGGKKRRRY